MYITPSSGRRIPREPKMCVRRRPAAVAPDCLFQREVHNGHSVSPNTTEMEACSPAEMCLGASHGMANLLLPRCAIAMSSR